MRVSLVLMLLVGCGSSPERDHGARVATGAFAMFRSNQSCSCTEEAAGFAMTCGPTPGDNKRFFLTFAAGDPHVRVAVPLGAEWRTTGAVTRAEPGPAKVLALPAERLLGEDGVEGEYVRVFVEEAALPASATCTGEPSCDSVPASRLRDGWVWCRRGA